MTKTEHDQITMKGGDTVLHARTTLVFYHRDGATVGQLEKGRSIVVGRSAPADIEIPDPGLSRQHARFGWDDNGLWVEDLGSTNGTKRNGSEVARSAISPGDDIAMGPVAVSVHIMSSADAQLRGFDSHDRFVASLDEEITRARTFGRSLAVVLVRGATKEDRVSRWASRLRMALRPVDRVGMYGPAAALVALPEATPELVGQLVSALTTSSTLSCSVAMFPGDGASVEELIAALQVMRTTPPAAGDDDEPASAIVVKSPAMKQVMAMVKRVAGATIAVLVLGETGTGKEVIARAIHDGGPRRKGPLRSINCGAIPGSLLESVLFGHEQGAFTSADKAARGLFEQASGGTLLLDEIGELALGAQAALLRVLETKKLTRVGGDRELDVDVRVIAATHRDLDAMVETGRFRQDLLFRLNTMTLRLPPLRERVEEIRPLAERFLKEARRVSGTAVRSIEPAAMAMLEAYSWPGNVRELRNAIERAVAMAEGTAVTVADLTDRVRAGSARVTSPPGELSVLAARAGASSDDVPSDYRDHLRKYEIELILRALHKFGGNQTEAAKALGLPLRTLVHKIQTYGIKKKFDR